MKTAMTLTGLEGARQALRYCNSYDRLPTLVEVWNSCKITTNDWLTALGEEWSSCDDVGIHAKWLMTKSPLLHGLHNFPNSPLRRCLMNEEEWKAYRALSANVTVFRGCYRSNKRGLSWTLDRGIAERFPTLNRYKQDGQPLLLTAHASKAKHILAVKLDRDEFEVVAWLPEIVSTEKIGNA